MHILNGGARDGSHGHGWPFLERELNNFDVSRQLAERREACLLCLLPRQRVRGGSQHEEKLLLTSGGRASVHSGGNIGSNIAQSKTSFLMWHVFNEERCV